MVLLVDTSQSRCVYPKGRTVRNTEDLYDCLYPYGLGTQNPLTGVDPVLAKLHENNRAAKVALRDSESRWFEPEADAHSADL